MTYAGRAVLWIVVEDVVSIQEVGGHKHSVPEEGGRRKRGGREGGRVGEGKEGEERVREEDRGDQKEGIQQCGGMQLLYSIHTVQWLHGIF